MKTIAATCSTERAECVFQDAIFNSTLNALVCKCDCKGESSLFTGSDNMVSAIHYWICPVIS